MIIPKEANAQASSVLMSPVPLTGWLSGAPTLEALILQQLQPHPTIKYQQLPIASQVDRITTGTTSYYYLSNPADLK